MSRAVIMADQARTRLSLGSEVMRLQQPDKDRESRFNYSLSARTPLKSINKHRFHGELFLMSVPDNEPRPRSVDIRQNYLGGFVAISYSFVYLFRYNLSIGNGIWRATTKSNIQSQAEERSIYIGSTLQKISLDYAFNDWIEASIQTTTYYRYEHKKLDWAYGLSVNINLDQLGSVLE